MRLILIIVSRIHTMNPIQKFSHLAILSAALIGGGHVQADENLFGYTYGAEVLPKGAAELYTYQTFRFGKESGDYLGWDQQVELEYGMSDRLQLILEAKTNYVDIDNVPGFKNRSSFGLRALEIGAKYNVLSPFMDPVGLSFVAEAGWVSRDATTGDDINGYETEIMAIIQKNFLDNTLIWSTNIFAEIGQEDGDYGWGPTVFTGVSYRFAPNWYAGFEGHWDADFEELQIHDKQHWDVFAGPVLHYGSKLWWATVSLQFNVASWPDTNGSHLNLDDHERTELRLKLGYNF